ncbi:hypothetical protein BH09ACT8_BH09ACT8_39720 [soil metagenome]
MGRHKYVGHVRALAVAIGVGAALAGGAGMAHADAATDRGTDHAAGPTTARPSAAKPSKLPSRVPHVSATAQVKPGQARNPPKIGRATHKPLARQRDSPLAPATTVFGALQLIGREIERIGGYHPPSTTSFTEAETYANAHAAVASGVPSPGEETHTAYGDVGKWMLQPDGQIANYGGQPYGGKTLLEPVNVIIVDPTSTTATQAAWKLNSAMFWAGFPAQPIHSSGFQGEIDNVVYGQQPSCLLTGYADNFFLFPNDHGRIFGPDPVQTSTGYVWSGAFSTETLGFYNFLPVHAYVSSDLARTALAMRLILSGQATFVGMVPLDNSYNTGTTTTGDHDGYAVVLQLT